eukprot:TRINITY_DN5320_c1_g1_i1.p2 TRINITY_DN5320_c1_g1~~TRINITY_DN5320_c1_g1_i1.p2  ORF type:complete len:278 (-),score=49.34 TRINITY_DN5320_c1_g1_i1:653-1486(-)
MFVSQFVCVSVDSMTILNIVLSVFWALIVFALNWCRDQELLEAQSDVNGADSPADAQLPDADAQLPDADADTNADANSYADADSSADATDSDAQLPDAGADTDADTDSGAEQQRRSGGFGLVAGQTIALKRVPDERERPPIDFYGLELLPDEIVELIAMRLPLPALAAFSVGCRRLRRVAWSDVVWRSLYWTDFPRSRTWPRGLQWCDVYKRALQSVPERAVEFQMVPFRPPFQRVVPCHCPGIRPSPSSGALIRWSYQSVAFARNEWGPGRVDSSA